MADFTAVQQIKQTVIDLVSSKKFLVGITSSMTAILVRLSTKLNLGIDAETASQISWTIVSLAGLYLAAQGAADFGKHAEEARQDGKSTPQAIAKP